MEEMRLALEKSKNVIREKMELPRIGVVLGSGLGGFADQMEEKVTVDFQDMHLPAASVEGHKGRFLFGYLGEVPLVVMQGRIHYYEGHTMHQVVAPIRFLGMLGVENLFLTNAAGGMGDGFYKGNLMLIRDHISLFVPNPLMGKSGELLGPRFPDMTEVYDRDLRDIVQKTAMKQGLDLKEGVYVQLTGPSLETPAEIRLLKQLGADAVGMSTVCEAIAARHMGVRVCGISCITNLAAGLGEGSFSHEAVQQEAARAGEGFGRLLKGSVEALYSRIR